MVLSGISISVYSPSCSSVGTQCSQPPVYENVENCGGYMESSTKSAHRYANGHYYPVCSSNDNPTYKSNSSNDSDPSVGSSNESNRMNYDTMDTNTSIRPKKAIDMRPLSLPPPVYKGKRKSERKCYLFLGLTTVAVFGFAFALWMLFDTLEQFIEGIFI